MSLYLLSGVPCEEQLFVESMRDFREGKQDGRGPEEGKVAVLSSWEEDAMGFSGADDWGARGSSVGGRRGKRAGEPQVETERLVCDCVAGRMMTVDSRVGMVVI